MDTKYCRKGMETNMTVAFPRGPFVVFIVSEVEEGGEESMD